MNKKTDNTQQAQQPRSKKPLGILIGLIIAVFGSFIVFTIALLIINVLIFPSRDSVAQISDDYMQDVIESNNSINSELSSLRPIKFTRLDSSYYVSDNRRNVSTSFAYVFENKEGDYYYVGINWERYLWPFKKEINPRIINATSNPKAEGLWYERAALREELENKKLVGREFDECERTLLSVPASATSEEWRMAVTDSLVCKQLKEDFSR